MTIVVENKVFCFFKIAHANRTSSVKAKQLPEAKELRGSDFNLPVCIRYNANRLHLSVRCKGEAVCVIGTYRLKWALCCATNEIGISHGSKIISAILPSLSLAHGCLSFILRSITFRLFQYFLCFPVLWGDSLREMAMFHKVRQGHQVSWHAVLQRTNSMGI